MIDFKHPLQHDNACQDEELMEIALETPNGKETATSPA